MIKSLNNIIIKNSSSEDNTYNNSQSNSSNIYIRKQNRFSSRKKSIKEVNVSETISESITESNIPEQILSSIDIKNIKIDELIYPCKDEILITKVLLHPHQMNNDLYINLKKNLIDKVEGKCYKDGYIIKVFKIIDYKNGIIEPEYLTGSAIFDVKYLANICVAIRESIIIAKISSYLSSANFVLADFGIKPIIKIIFTKNSKDINTNNFIINNDKNIIHSKTKKYLDVGDYIKIQIKTIRYFQYDKIISCIGHLIDLASKEEIEKFAYHENNDLYDKDLDISSKSEKDFSNILINEEI